MNDDFFKVPEGIDVPDLNLLGHKLTKRNIKTKYNDFYNWIDNLYTMTNNISEKLFLFKNKLSEPPKCENVDCKNYARFVNYYFGYFKCCCADCSNKLRGKSSKEIWEYIKTHNILHNSFTKESKQKRVNKLRENQMRKIDSLIGYTDDGKWIFECTQQENCKYFNICNKTFITDKGNYSFRKQYNHEQCTKLYPIGSHKHNTEYKRTNGREAFLKKQDLIIGYADNENEWIVKCTNTCCNLCKEKSFVIKKPLFYKRKYNNIEMCTKLNPLNCGNISQFEIKIKEILNQLNIKCEYNKRNLIEKPNSELDIYLVDYQIAIECNGSYYHSLKNPKMTKNKHLIKWEKCKNNGIELISIWEDWSYDDIENFLKAKLENDWKTIIKYKKKWFPDLSDYEWPLDLGFPSDFSISNLKTEHIKEHLCYHHKKYECFDSGILVV